MKDRSEKLAKSILAKWEKQGYAQYSNLTELGSPLIDAHWRSCRRQNLPCIRLRKMRKRANVELAESENIDDLPTDLEKRLRAAMALTGAECRMANRFTVDISHAEMFSAELAAILREQNSRIIGSGRSLRL